jgi:acyl-CoA synthetase (AMP-forming)/AMP-acid ligase II
VQLPLQTRIEAATVLARRGFFRPVRPDRLVRAGIGLVRWGTTIAAAFVTHGADAPNQIAIADDEGELTYCELDARTNALARGLTQRGVQEEDSIAVLCRNGRGFLETVIAGSKVGADILLLNTSFSATELKGVAERERPRLLVYDGEFSTLVERADVDTPTLIAHVEGAPPDRDTLAAVIERGDRSALKPPKHESRPVILTSGTTGTPKGARVAQPENLDPLAWFLSIVPLHARSTYLIEAPAFHAHGFGQVIIGAALACKLVLPRRFDPEDALALVERHRATGLVAVPVMLKRIMELPAEARRRHDTSSLRVVLCSGSALSPQLAREFMDEFGPVIYNLYGSTELSAGTIATPEDLLTAPGTVGRALPHTRIAILDDGGKLLPQGSVGHIFVGHEMLFEGYTDGSRLDESSDGMMSAGDLGHLDADGRLFIDSRADDMIISGGENVYPSEVEAVLARHPDIDEVAAVGVDDEQFGQRFVVFAVPRSERKLEPEQVLAYAKENLARYKVPREVRVLDELPKNALGKVLRRELRELV